MRNVTILGSTGSIGRQALEVIDRHPEELSVHALVCNSSLDLLVEQALKYRPKRVVINDEQYEKPLKKALKISEIEVLAGRDAVLEVAQDPESDIVLSAMVGFSGLEPTLKALESGISVALANKEVLVVAGEIVHDLSKKHNALIFPVDSEHSAIFQCLMGESGNPAKKIYLTASGGPFVDTPVDKLSLITPEDALKHPNWSMGPKVTIDSATMMNKGLEMIEAHYLFGLDPKAIEVVVHRQSIIHSMVGFEDGSVKAQLSLPDMRLPIAFALLYPRRVTNITQLPTVEQMGKLTLEAPRWDAFPSLRLAYDAIEIGGTAPCVLNAANEVAVERFLQGQIRFTDIPRIVEYTLEKSNQRSSCSLDLLIETDKWARQTAQAWHKGL
ncbi:MAG: 1-deoxy-D-xylulose-5-phosphate reductoisomerase [Porphyromonas sp.]|nr:1-deoxy-D-xylulose-5-phosphate reductoisomerase [Porphyromonas sp.]